MTSKRDAAGRTIHRAGISGAETGSCTARMRRANWLNSFALLGMRNIVNCNCPKKGSPGFARADNQICFGSIPLLILYRTWVQSVAMRTGSRGAHHGQVTATGEQERTSTHAQPAAELAAIRTRGT